MNKNRACNIHKKIKINHSQKTHNHSSRDNDFRRRGRGNGNSETNHSICLETWSYDHADTWHSRKTTFGPLAGSPEKQLFVMLKLHSWFDFTITVNVVSAKYHSESVKSPPDVHLYQYILFCHTPNAGFLHDLRFLWAMDGCHLRTRAPRGQ
jgi:hypothetical protein